MTETPHYHGHRERLRERFANSAGEGMPDYELLELLLTFAIPRRDVKALAKELLAEFGSLRAVLDAPLERLCGVCGLSWRSAVQIRLVKELCSRYLAEGMIGKEVMGEPQIVVDFAKLKLADSGNEAFMVIYVDTKNQVMDWEIINEGTVDQAVVYPRNIVKQALQNQATGLLLVHNHPSGNCQPSNPDMNLTKAIKEAAGTVDIRLLDHLVVGGDSYFSFVEEGVL